MSSTAKGATVVVLDSIKYNSLFEEINELSKRLWFFRKLHSSEKFSPEWVKALESLKDLREI